MFYGHLILKFCSTKNVIQIKPAFNTKFELTRKIMEITLKEVVLLELFFVTDQDPKIVWLYNKRSVKIFVAALYAQD